MNRTAKRFGNAAGDVVSAKAEKDSSHGKATVTPAPRRMARRDTRPADFSVGSGIFFLFVFLFWIIRDPFGAELRTGHDDVDQGSKAVAVPSQPCQHGLNRRLIGKLERPAESERQQLP